jgi:hypothetical protein
VAALHQDIQSTAVLIHGPPEIMTFAIDGEIDLVKMPFVPGPGAPAAELIGRRLAKFATPFPHRFVRDNDATGKQQFSDIPVAKAEAEVQPDTVADDLGRETVVLITVRGECAHTPSMAHGASLGQLLDKLMKWTRLFGRYGFDEPAWWRHCRPPFTERRRIPWRSP